MEVTEVTKFLAETTPFDQLDAEQLQALARQMSVYYFRAGEEVNTDSNRLMIVRTGVFSLYSDQQQLLTKLQSGDFYGYQQLLTDLHDQDTLLCDEDGLVYWLTAEGFQHIRYQFKNIELFFQRLFGRRLHQYKSQSTNRFTLKISDVAKARKVSIPPDATVQQAAAQMTEQRVSSLLVERNNKLVGIITDRDLRSRVVAEALPADSPVSDVMTSQPHTIDLHAYLFEAVQLMSQHNIHHLPVLKDEQLFGMITATDVIRAQQDHPVYLIGEIHRQHTEEGILQCASQILHLSQSLSAQQVPAHEASHVLTTVTDALTQSWIKLAIKQLGAPPCVFTWLGFGSQARMEQGLNADQDNALLLEKEPEGEIAMYFEQLAKIVCDGLNECGIVYCPGNIMASNPELRLSLKGWSNQFARWIQTPTQEALLKSSIFFDLRPIYGSKSLFNALQQDILARTTDKAVFLYHLSHNALKGKPPLGFFKTFTLERDGKQKKGLDLKKRGLILITDMARIYSLSKGISAINTRQRLIQLAQQKVMDAKDSQNLLDAFDVLAQLRWDKHQHDVAQGHEASNLLDPAVLSGLQRHQLKDVFEVINQTQSQMKYRFCREL
ncbi:MULTISPECIES: putative nucleotidyltransferase substrate binding domain-containing protein [Alkalimonas]|uniref:Nucleotidyltransferase substrate binding domain-containing protein n=1 Tax=Alkalimonas mucilaginosa TaxID=3057676 RepID=A0ABU7JJ14_9GAMM|nr:putative nucleotidyltransferase substrate binding domain-containing protein [Alkalimonas sp. MEB004]MEE2025693.1 putative nucleotidyltransferase substrate binding domain-containing protein [Alkalimonas sp. MEB004]